MAVLAAAALGAGAAFAGPGGGTFYANSPAPNGVVGPDGMAVPNASGTPLRKFVDSLPGLNAPNNLGQSIPIATPDVVTYPGADYYEIVLEEYRQRMHSDLPAPGTNLRGYVQVNKGTDVAACPATGCTAADNTVAPAGHQYLGPVIVATQGRAVRIKFTNLLTTDLNIPVDTTVMGADARFSQKRATIHLHGGYPPWISDGTAHQWIAPAADAAPDHRGVSVVDVPDMGPSADGSMTFYWPNLQSARLMFYHDHAFGTTRLNVYVGEAAGYLIRDPQEIAMEQAGLLPPLGLNLPLVIQDKTFVPADIAAQDAQWNTALWGGPGDLWFPHVYEPNQLPPTIGNAGINPLGRWDYGPWMWPPAAVAVKQLPNPSITPESFMDTPVVNGTAYPYVDVEPTVYRLRILNAANDRAWNLNLIEAAANADPLASLHTDSGEIKTVLAPNGLSAVPVWGPPMVQIGTEGGFLPASTTIAQKFVTYDLDRRSATFGNVKDKSLLLGPAERADVLVDFSAYAGKTLILYNDAGAPIPLFDPRYDYFTGGGDQRATGGADNTLAGYGPNTRTILQVRVKAGPPTATPITVNASALDAALSGAYAVAGNPSSLPAKIIPDGCYGTNRLQSGTLFPDATNSLNCPAGTPTYPVHLKTIAEDFDVMYGRMNAKLGTEQSSLNTQGQQTFGFAFADPPTEIFDTVPSSATKPDGDTQIWMVVHNGVDTHAIHFHLVNVQVVNRVDWAGVVKPPDANETGWKDTVRMNPLENVILAVQAKAPPAVPFAVPESVRPLDPSLPVSAANPYWNLGHEYVWHCHLLGHEENDMMRPLLLKAGGTAAVAPVPPSAVDAVTTSVSGAPPLTVTVGWAYTANPQTQTGFVVQRATDAAFTAGVVTLPAANAAARSLVDNGVLPGTTYYYRVAAQNVPAGGVLNQPIVQSVFVASGPVTTPTAPVAPATPKVVVSALSVAAPTATLTWTYTGTAANPAAAFVVQRATANTAAGWAAATVAGTVDGATLKFVDALSSVKGAIVYYRILARNGAGNSPASAVLTATSPGQLPAAATGLKAVAGPSAGTSRSIVLTWTNNVNGSVTPTAVVAKATIGTAWASPKASVTGTSSLVTATLTGLQLNTKYNLRVETTNPSGTTTSAVISFTTPK